MEDQLRDLLSDMLFHFKHRTDKLLTYESLTPRLMGHCLSYFEIQVFDDSEKNLLRYESFDNLVELYRLHRVAELPLVQNSEMQILFISS